MKEILKAIYNPSLILLFFLRKYSWLFKNDMAYIKIEYFLSLKKILNLKNPQSFNEKLQWLKLYNKNPLYTKLVDKYEVRKHISETIGKEYLIPLIGVWDKFEDIDFSKLPNQFVLKCNHDSGGLVICEDKSKIDIEKTRKKINNSLKRNYYYGHREWPYKNVKPKIVCEKYMVDESGTELKDYKFMCFNGKVKCSFVCLNRNSPDGLNVDFYDMDWNLMPFERHYKQSGNAIPKPYNFKKMVEFAEKLSKNIPFLRVDFYETDEKLYFGELTFYPGSGYEEFTPESFDYLLGSWIKLPQKQVEQI
ncbi:MAG: ATP-grasp fold amidoligase family protein [Clostridia bacterium]